MYYHDTSQVSGLKYSAECEHRVAGAQHPMNLKDAPPCQLHGAPAEVQLLTTLATYVSESS